MKEKKREDATIQDEIEEPFLGVIWCQIAQERQGIERHEERKRG